MSSGQDGLAGLATRGLAWFEASLPGRIYLRYRRIDGRDRTIAVAGLAFTSMIPLLIVVAAFSSEDDAAAQRIINRFQLTGVAADAVTLLFSRPPGATGAITIIGILVLFYSTLSFTRGLQRLYEAAWELPQAGVRGTLNALTGFALLVAQIIALALVASAVSGWPGGDVLSFVLRSVIAAVLWLQLQYLLLSRRVRRGLLIPGAVMAGIGQVAISVYSAVWMPRLIEIDAERYGVIGVTFALLTWLIVVAFFIVAGAVVSAEMRLNRHRLTPIEEAEAERTGTTGDTGDTDVATGEARTFGAVTIPSADAVVIAVREKLAALGRADPTDRFGAVLLVVVATVVWTAASPDTWWAHVSVLFLQTLTLFMALRAARASGRVITVAAGLWFLGAVVAAIAALAGADSKGLSAALGVGLLVVALVVVLRRLIHQPDVSPSTVAGAISAYLLLGLVFTWTYALLATVGQDPFGGPGANTTATFNEYLYFAFTTLTTTGFGDIAPVTDVGRAIAILEALLGQLYLVTVLALVIGNMRPRRDRARRDQPQETASPS